MFACPCESLSETSVAWNRLINCFLLICRNDTMQEWKITGKRKF